MTILILQADRSVSELLSARLRMEGFDVAAYQTASQAWDRLREAPVALVIADFLIKRGEAFVPEGGIVLANKLRMNGYGANAWMADVPIVITHAPPRKFKTLDPRRLLGHLRIDAFVAEPIDFDGLALRARLLVGGTCASSSAVIAAE